MTATTGPIRVGSAELLWTLVERQLRLRSKRSVMGVAWPFAAPLFLLALYAYVFGRVFEVPVEDYPAYLFAGLLPWTFLVQAVHDSLQSISFEPELVRRARFPYHLLPVARVVVMAVPFSALLVGFVAYLAATRGVRLELLPVLVLPVVAVTLLVTALSVLLALLDVYNRDLRFVLHNLLTVWFFLVPIVYRPEMADGGLRLLQAVDPMNLVVQQFRDILYWGELAHPGRLGVLVVGSAAMFGAALAVFRRAAAELPKQV